MTYTHASEVEAPTALPSRFLRRALGSPLLPITLALVLVCGVMTALSASFLTATNLTNIVVQSAVVGIAAVGATFVIVTGGIDLSVGSNIALSGLLGAMVAQDHGGLAGIVTTLVVALIVGLFNGVSITWLKLTPFIVTLAAMGIARGLTLQQSQGQTVYDLPAVFIWLGSAKVGGINVVLILTVVMFVSGHLILKRTTFGHRVYAAGGNAEASRLAGINVDRTVLACYVIAGLCAGLAALVLVGRLGSAAPNAATGTELQVIAAVVIGGTSLFGGKGSVVGTFIGVLLIGVINNGLTLLNVSPFWVQTVQGTLIFLAVLLDSFNNRRMQKQLTAKRSVGA
ncbi:ABC transporter permease [Aeromicrobium sp. IC_218]|uniref:ABC transporter permease n=1 Tax=Aeromicrobium sp. IC_218 TaxID=2545468 RepID=UPI00103DBFAC|nr:ABC transporter permease [Aeromicrobium sp. IC_218]TCI96366.1 ABC transporter permease [Aeromicrobium sp. IC_218]